VTARTFVEPLGPVKAWLRGQSLSVGQRVYIGDPKQATLPYLALQLVDGETDLGDAPTMRVRVQVCAQGATEQDAADLIFEAVSVCESLDPGEQLDAGLDCFGAQLALGPTPRLDEAGPRYLADIEFQVIAR
jgi:hypothetical protein